MELQILISTMHQTDYELLKRMNINSDAIVINQCEENKVDEFKYKDYSIKWMSFNERGVGLSRNTALMRAISDICLFADDDMVYRSNYKDLVMSAFEKCPDADIITFNINSKDKVRNRFMNEEYKRLTIFNSLKYGSPRIAIRLNSLKKANVFFSLLYGGGAIYSSGEDSLFLVECIKKGLKVYACPEFIGEVDDSSSTWFDGFTDKLYYDKGIWIANAFPMMKYGLAMYFAYNYKKKSKDKSFKYILKQILLGIKNYEGHQLKEHV